MGKKLISWKTKGMNRDLSVSAFNPEFSFENRNLRLSTNEFNTLLSWVNERGTKRLTLVEKIDNDYVPLANNRLLGVPIGTAIINHQLIVFTTEAATLNQTQRDYIYRLTYSDAAKETLLCEMLFGVNNLSLGFNIEHPLETQVSFESESVQKVYWTDGINQPRVINIVGKINQSNVSQFDFVPELTLEETVTVEKMLGANGMFAPGVIQYALTYYRKNGQESNIFYTSPLNYISHRDRGASPEDKVENAFRITVQNPDSSFDYLRIYSIQRTSIDGTPIVKRVQDISLEGVNPEEALSMTRVSSDDAPTVWLNGTQVSGTPFTVERTVFGISNVSCKAYPHGTSDYIIKNGEYNITYGESATENSVLWITANKLTYGGINAYWIFETPTTANDGNYEDIKVTSVKLSYIDAGTSGDTIDPTELLYKGGETISIGTMEQKDNTLFMGNIEIKRASLKDKADVIKDNTSVASSTRSIYPEVITSGNYDYASQLTSYSNSARNISVPCGGFKAGDAYRLGLQFQYKTGKWSEPIWIGDYTQANRPSYDAANHIVTLPTFQGTFGGTAQGDSLLTTLIGLGYKRLRPVVVFPRPADRNVVCQGVANKTMYTPNHRSTKKDVYAQSSWFFRPSNGGNVDDNTGAVSPYNTAGELPYTQNDISGAGKYSPGSQIKQVEIQGDFRDEQGQGSDRFCIDNNFVTYHSPDIEFDEQLKLVDFSNTTAKQVGCVDFSCTFSDIDIQTVTPTCSGDGSGFVHQSFSLNRSGNKSIHGIVSGLFYDDYVIEDWAEYAEEKNVIRSLVKEGSSAKWMVYLWNKNGALNNDIIRPANKGTMTAELKKKVVSNLRYADTTKFFGTATNIGYIDTPQMFYSDQPSILKFGNNIYQGNVDALLIPNRSDGQYFAYNASEITDAATTSFTFHGPSNWWKTFAITGAGENSNPGLYRYGGSTWGRPDDGESRNVGNQYTDIVLKKEGVRMKYKSTPHLAFGTNGDISWNKYADSDTSSGHVLPVLEIYQTPVQRFGGTSEDAFKENVWIPCGEPVRLNNTTTVEGHNAVLFTYSYGDTYFQRWDCLKTYAFTREDPNQVVEIGSFMLETHTNIDGRYDRNRGQVNNLNMSPQNFNLFNPVYNQIDNFFTYRIQDKSYYRDTKFPNQVTWSKTKNSGADVDLWTNVTLASILELDGDKGSITKLTRINDQLIAFQDTGIARILYNEMTQISTEQGIPVELSNSNKVSGKQYYSDTIGCSNKWSIVPTPTGIYFVDSNDKSIYLFNGQLNNLSTKGGFNTWCKWSIPPYGVTWNPSFPEVNGQSALVGYHDKMNQEILFINGSTSLAYSEKLDAFTSFYDYQGAAFFCNLEDTGIWIKTNTLWKHQAGDYCRFFGVNKPYSMILIANAEPQLTKTFTNLEFRASVDNDMWYDETTQKYYPYLPFDSLEVWDEYQHGIGYLKDGKDVRPSSHHQLDNNANLNRKFRIWRTDVPRDNADNADVFDETFDRTFHIIARLQKHPLDRMRNPWLYLRLRKAAAEDEIVEGETVYHSLNRTELQDIVMTYFD